MNEKELDALERDARALRDPKDRKEALNGVAELRAVQSNLEIEHKAPARTPTARTFLFAGASAFAGALAFWNIHSSGVERGFFEVGWRSTVRHISQSTDPIGFEIWSAIFILACVAFSIFGVWSLWSAWKLSRCVNGTL